MTVTHCVYRIVCFSTCMCYVGQTVDPRVRIRDHFWELRNNRHPNKHLQNAFDLYGSGVFYHEILEKGILFEHINEREEYWIAHFDSFHNGYNKSAGGHDFSHYGIPCIWNGIEYPSSTVAARAIGVSPATMQRRRIAGLTCDADLDCPQPHWISCEWNGNQYRSITEAAKANGYTLGAMYKYLKEGRRSDGDIPKRSKGVVWNGIRYKNAKLAAIACGISISSMCERLNKGYTCDDDLHSATAKRQKVIDGHD